MDLRFKDLTYESLLVPSVPAGVAAAAAVAAGLHHPQHLHPFHSQLPPSVHHLAHSLHPFSQSSGHHLHESTSSLPSSNTGLNSNSRSNHSNSNNTSNNSTNNTNINPVTGKVKRARQRVDAGEPRNSYASITNFSSTRSSAFHHPGKLSTSGLHNSRSSGIFKSSSSSSLSSSTPSASSSSLSKSSSGLSYALASPSNCSFCSNNQSHSHHHSHHLHSSSSSSSSVSHHHSHHHHHRSSSASTSSHHSNHHHSQSSLSPNSGGSGIGNDKMTSQYKENQINFNKQQNVDNIVASLTSSNSILGVRGSGGASESAVPSGINNSIVNLNNMYHNGQSSQSSSSSSQQQQQFITNYYQQLISFSKNTPPSVPSSPSSPIPLLTNVDLASSLPLSLQPPTRPSSSQHHISPSLHSTVSSSTTTPTLNPPSYSSFIQASTSPSQSIPSEYDGSSTSTGGVLNTVGTVSGSGKRELDQEEEIGSEGNSSSSPSAHLLRVILQKGRGQRKASSNRNENNNNQVNCDKIGSNSLERTRKGQNDDDETDEEKDEDDCETDSGRTITGSPTGNNSEEGGDKVDDEEDDDEDDNCNNNNQHNNNNNNTNEYNNNEDDDQVFSSTVGGLPEDDDDDDATDDGRNDDDYPEASCSVESEGEPDGDDYSPGRPGGTNTNASKLIGGVSCTRQSDRYNSTCDEYNNNANNDNNNEIMNLNGDRGVDHDSGTELKSAITLKKTIKSTDCQSDRDQSDLLSGSNEISTDNHNNNNGSSCSDDVKSSSDLPLQLTSEIGDNHQQLTSSSSSCSTSVTTTTSTISANGLTTISDVKRARVENIVTNMLPRSSSNFGHLSKLSNIEDNINHPIESSSSSVIKERKKDHSTKTLSVSESSLLVEAPTTTLVPTGSNLTSGSSVIVNGCKKRKLYHPQQSKSNGSLDDEESDDLDDIVGEDEDDDEMIGGESQVKGDASGLDDGVAEEDDEMNDSQIGLSSERLDDYEMSEIKDLSIKSSVKCESGDKSDYDESNISIKENSDRRESRLSTLMENYEPNSSLTESRSNNIPKDLSKSSSSSLGNSGRSHKRKDHNHHHGHRLSDDADEDAMADDELGALGDDDSRLNHAVPSSQVNLSKSPHHLSSSSSHHHHRRFGVGLQDPISLLNEARKLVYEQEKMTKGNSSNPSSSSNHESHHHVNPHHHHHRHSSRSSRKRSLVPPLISTASSSMSNMVNGGPLGNSDLPLPPTSPPLFYSDIEWLRDTLKADLQVNSIPSFSTIIDSVINRFCQRRAASAAAAAALASRSSIGTSLHPQYSILPQKDSSDLMIGRNPDSLAAVAVAAAMASASRSSLPNTNHHHHHHHPFPLLPPSHKEPEDLIMSRNSDSSANAVTPTSSNRLSISNQVHNPFQISPPKEPEDLILQRNSDSFAAVAAAALASRSSILPTIHPQYQILPHKEPEDLMLKRSSDSYVAAAAAAAAAVAASRSAAASDSTAPETSKELTLLSQMLESKSSRTIHGKPFESSNQQSQQSNHHHSKTNVPRESPSQQQQQQSSSSQHTSSSSHHHRQLSTPLNTSASNGSNNDSPLNGHHQLLHPHLAHHSQGSSSSISPAPSTGAPPGENSPNWWAAINIENNSTLTPMHLRKAKLMFFYVRYPSSNVLKTFFPDIKFGKNNTAQLVKWFSNFREFYYIQMEKYARQAMTEGIKSADEIHVHRESELLRVLNMHYNRSNHLDVPERFCFVVEQTLKEFFKSIAAGKDNEQSWKKAIYKIISRLDDPVPEYFKSPNFLERLE